MSTLRLAKHHGLGNDFLVLVDLEDRHALGPDVVAALCDRRRGVGADGFIRVVGGRDGADLGMELRNGDGGQAPMSGNGIRCLAQAAIDAGVVPGPELTVRTGAGVRRLRVERSDEPDVVHVQADMGPVRVSPEDEDVRWAGRRWTGRRADVGNPHLVLVDDALDRLDLESVGPGLEASWPGGVNVEWVSPGPGPDDLALRVWERGAGATLACGTGSVAAAAAAVAMKLVGGPRVAVHNPGGRLLVDLTPAGAVLVGPAQRVATVLVELSS